MKENIIKEIGKNYRNDAIQLYLAVLVTGLIGFLFIISLDDIFYISLCVGIIVTMGFCSSYGVGKIEIYIATKTYNKHYSNLKVGSQVIKKYNFEETREDKEVYTIKGYNDNLVLIQDTKDNYKEITFSELITKYK